MKKVKVSKLKDGDLFIYGGSYYKVLDSTPRKKLPGVRHIETKCFMAPTRAGEVSIGMIVYLPLNIKSIVM